MNNEGIILDESFRKKIWDKLSEHDYTIKELKGIVQNSMPITNEEMDKYFTNIKNTLIKDLNDIEKELYSEICYQAYHK